MAKKTLVKQKRNAVLFLQVTPRKWGHYERTVENSDDDLACIVEDILNFVDSDKFEASMQKVMAQCSGPSHIRIDISTVAEIDTSDLKAMTGFQAEIRKLLETASKRVGRWQIREVIPSCEAGVVFSREKLKDHPVVDIVLPHEYEYFPSPVCIGIEESSSIEPTILVDATAIEKVVGQLVSAIKLGKIPRKHLKQLLDAIQSAQPELGPSEFDTMSSSELVQALVDGGLSVRKIGLEIGRSHTHVGNILREDKTPTEAIVQQLRLLAKKHLN